MFGRPVSLVSLDGELKAAASAPVQISSEALPGETASPSSASVMAQLAVLSNADLVDVVDAEYKRRLSRLGIVPRFQAASMARPKRVRVETFETPTRGTRRASERTLVKEESAAKSRRAVEAVTSSDVTSRKGPATGMESSGVRAATPPPPNVVEKRQRSTPVSAKPAKKVGKPESSIARFLIHWIDNPES